MKRPGPYKQYQVDPSIGVPKQTVHNRRKRRIINGMESKVSGTEGEGDKNIQVCSFGIFIITIL